MQRKFWLLMPLFMAGCQLNNNNAEPTAATTSPALTQPESVTAVNNRKMGSSLPAQALICSKLAAEAQHSITNQADDLWIYLADNFQFEIPKHARITAQYNWYKKHPHYMARVSQRAEPFLYLIVQEIHAQELPLELALLPIVESAFDPFAYSHGRASGLWQFVPGTAKRFGLEQNWWYDGRRDVHRSTQAALRYLTYLHRYFDGDWLHALAAYNSGEGRVRRAIKRNIKAGKPTDFWNLKLPKETQAYVPKLLALADIIKRQQELKLSIPRIKNQQHLAQVNTGSQIDLALAADMLGIDLKTLQKLNPGYNRWATPPQGPHTLLIPEHLTATFTQSLAELKTEQRLQWARHKVVTGDTLGGLALKYHTSVDVIRSMNNLKGNTIRLNQALLIPVASKALNQYSLSVEQRLAKTQSIPRGKRKITHKVKSGDNFWDLGKKYQVNHRQIAKWNGMAPTDPLKLNQSLVIWQSKAATVTPQTRIKSPQSNSVMRKITYKVRNGDSLARIADKFQVKVVDLLHWNQLNKKHYIQPGQKIKLYVDVTEVKG